MFAKVNKDRIKNLQNIPSELKNNKHWVTVQFGRDKKGNVILNSKGKPNKEPFKPNGYHAKPNDSNTWNTFDHCLNTFKNNNKNNLIEGLGYVLSLDDDFAFIDIDNIEVNKQEKLKFINSFNSYTELSQSGKGYHIIVKVKYGKKEFEQWANDINLIGYSEAVERYNKQLENYKFSLEDYEKLTNEEKEKTKKPKEPIKSTLSSKNGDYEIYIEKRFFWLTGNIYNNKRVIKEVDYEKLRKTFEFIDSKSKNSTTNNKNTNSNSNKGQSKVIEFNKSPVLTNEEIINICNRAKNKDKFIQLWNEEGKDGNSETDQSLMNILAFYTQDVKQLCDLMMESPRYRGKFDTHPTYLERTANKAIIKLNGKCYKPSNYIEWDKNFISVKNEITYPILCSNNLKILLDYENISVKYNEMIRRIEFNNKILDDTCDTEIYELCLKYKFKNLKEALIPKMLNKIGFENSYHPMKEYFNNLKIIKGTNEIDKIFNSLILSEGVDVNFCKDLFITWLKMAVDAVYNPEFKSQGVLTLQGDGGIGKGTWLSKLAPFKSSFKGEIVGFDVHNKDSHDKVTTTWLCELAELESTFKKDFISLKGFLVSEFDDYRLPYGRRNKLHKRQTIFAASVNSLEFLRDDTGDRRFWVLELDNINWNIINSINLENFWGEVVNLYKTQGVKMKKETMEQIKENNKQYTVKTSIHGMLDSIIDKSTKSNIKSYTATEISNILSYKYNDRKLNPSSVGSTLRSLGYKSRRYTPSDRNEKNRYFSLGLITENIPYFLLPNFKN